MGWSNERIFAIFVGLIGLVGVVAIWLGVATLYRGRPEPNDTTHDRLVAVEATLQQADRQIAWLLRNQCRCPHNTGSTGEIGAK